MVALMIPTICIIQLLVRLVISVKKLDSKAVKEIFVGYGRTNDSYYLYNPVTGKISHSRNVSVNEKEILGFGFQKTVSFFQNPRVL